MSHVIVADRVRAIEVVTADPTARVGAVARDRCRVDWGRDLAERPDISDRVRFRHPLVMSLAAVRRRLSELLRDAA
jgi:hypothetical protein